MLNIIWPLFLIISFIYAILNGRISEVNNSIFESTKSAVELCISLIGTICLWNGIMQIASKTSIVKHLTKLLKLFVFLEIMFLVIHTSFANLPSIVLPTHSSI